MSYNICGIQGDICYFLSDSFFRMIIFHELSDWVKVGMLHCFFGHNSFVFVVNEHFAQQIKSWFVYSRIVALVYQ